MALLLVLIIYFSLVCYGWGLLSLRLLLRFSSPQPGPSLPTPLVCLTGFCFLTIIAAYLSLFLPLGGWWPILLASLPAGIAFFHHQRKGLSISVNLRSPGYLLLGASLILVLVMSSWKVVHPDTLAYHAQTIQWIEKYRAVPGLVHLHDRYGLQGLWFVACAFFNVPVNTGISVINSVIISWFFLFLCTHLQAGGGKKFLLAVFLLIAGMISFTQIRLTLTSASPDFIAVLLVWACFYLLLADASEQYYPSIFLFAFTAVTLKLSVFPIFLLLAVLLARLLKTRKWKKLWLLTATGLFVFFPFFARNIISSGHLVFPLAFTGWKQLDWTYPADATQQIRNYITAYARYPVPFETTSIQAALQAPLSEWIPRWWQQKNGIDRFILILAGLSIITLAFSWRKLIRGKEVLMLVVCTAGSMIWFFQAPDPRFGYAFLLPLPALAFLHVTRNMEIGVPRQLKTIILTGIFIGLNAYTLYRLVHFFSPDQLLLPLKTEVPATQEINCNGVIYRVPIGENDCGTNPLPCIYGNCGEIQPRGERLKDGFRARSPR